MCEKETFCYASFGFCTTTFYYIILNGKRRQQYNISSSSIGVTTYAAVPALFRLSGLIKYHAIRPCYGGTIHHKKHFLNFLHLSTSKE